MGVAGALTADAAGPRSSHLHFVSSLWRLTHGSEHVCTKHRGHLYLAAAVTHTAHGTTLAAAASRSVSPASSSEDMPCKSSAAGPLRVEPLGDQCWRSPCHKFAFANAAHKVAPAGCSCFARLQQRPTVGTDVAAEGWASGPRAGTRCAPAVPIRRTMSADRAHHVSSRDDRWSGRIRAEPGAR